ncbi:hypothetical protein EWP70_12755, partial [Neisseria meningitidis]|nr:hypothetical protein [Neisseria meningitidis]
MRSMIYGSMPSEKLTIFQTAFVMQVNIQIETFAKFLSLPTAETQTQVFGCFHLKSLLILPK